MKETKYLYGSTWPLQPWRILARVKHDCSLERLGSDWMGPMHTGVKVKASQLMGDGLLTHPTTIAQNSHWKVKRPQAGAGGTKQVVGLPPLI